MSGDSKATKRRLVVAIIIQSRIQGMSDGEAITFLTQLAIELSEKVAA